MVALEVAKKDVDKWLDFKRFTPARREEVAENIKNFINSVSDGTVIINEDFTVTHNLMFPFENEIKTLSLTYKARLDAGTVQRLTQNNKAGDFDARVLSYVAALSGQPKGVILKMDTEDYRIAQNYAIFFM